MTTVLIALIIVNYKQTIKFWQNIINGPLKNINRIAILWWLVALISNYQARDIRLAFFGSDWGQSGFYQITLCLIIFYVSQAIILNLYQWRLLAIVCVLITSLAFFESIGMRPLFWLPESGPYPAVTIGQRGHLAGLFLLMFGIALYKNSRSVLVLSIIGISLCNNSSALIAIIVTLIYSSVINRDLLIRNIVLSILCITSFIYIPAINKNLCKSLDNNNCTQTKTITSDNSYSFGVRMIFWKASIGMFLDKPIFGWGDEQYDQNWFKYLNNAEQRRMVIATGNLRQDAIISGKYPVFFYSYSDKNNDSPNGKFGVVRVSNIHPHNIFLEEFQNHGIIGSLMSSLFFLYIFIRFRRLILFILPYAIYLSAWFYLFSITPLYLFFLGTLLSREAINEKPAIYQNKPITGIHTD